LIMETIVEHITWQGLEAWVIESAFLRVVTIPQVGAKIVSLLDKRSGREWLVGAGDRTVRPVPYGALFHEQDMSGWDEMFPTIAASLYPGDGEHHGAPLPDHGEVWTLDWAVVQASEGCLAFAVEGRALPYRLVRTLTIHAPDTLDLHYQLTNSGRHSMPYIWAAHPLLACELEAEIVLPPEITKVCNTLPEEWGWGAPESRFDWPVAVDAKGKCIRLDRIKAPTLRCGRKFYVLPDARPNWAGVVRRPVGDWLQLTWNSTNVPYLGLWIDEGALSHESVVAPEPATGFYDALERAWAKQEVTVLEPGATNVWSLSAHLGTGDQPFLAKL
jgi:galactose mutarotase-like enzyme